MAKSKIVKKTIPHTITYQQIGDSKIRDALMKISENQKVIYEQIVNLQNAVTDLQKE